MRRGWALSLVVLLGSVLGCVSKPEAPLEPVASTAQRGLRAVAGFDGIEDEAARSRALFAEVAKVLTHPRCVNCHPASARPLQGERGLPHQPLVVRGPTGHGAPGMTCGTCHGTKTYRAMPGNPKWHLAPPEMAWEGKSLPEICAQIKDPARNGGMGEAELIHHMKEDELVAYGWAPPAHLEPAPGTQALAGALFAAWLQTGGHCPN